MKKWIYLIIPGVLLGLFLIFYFSHQKESEAREITRMEIAAKKIADEKKTKEDAEKRAREDAAQKQAEREAEEKKKDEERRAKVAAIDKELRDTTEAARAEGAKYQKEAAALQAELERLYREKDKLAREAFEFSKQVEAARVERRNAELESQRMIEMIVRRASDSSLVRMPTIPPPPTAATR